MLRTWNCFKGKINTIAESSKGRTRAFGTRYVGSNPASAAMINTKEEIMSAVFYTSDIHFGHEFLARGLYVNNRGETRQGIRGFNSVQEHDEELIRRWNSVISPNDTVIHAGDFSLKKPPV